MLDVKKLLAMMLGMVDKAIVTEKMTKSYTCAGNSTVAVDFVPSKAGYKPIGVVGYSTGNGYLLIQQCHFISDTTIRAYPRNVGSSSTTATFTITVLYVKSSLVGGGNT